MGNDLVVIRKELAKWKAGDLKTATADLAAAKVSGAIPAVFTLEKDSPADYERVPIRDHPFKVLFVHDPQTIWQFDLMTGLERVFFGRVCHYTTPSHPRETVIHARDINAEVIAAAWTYLADEVIRQSDQAHGGPALLGKDTTEWLSNYRQGMVEAISERLMQQFNDVKRVHGVRGINAVARAKGELDDYYAHRTHTHGPIDSTRVRYNADAHMLGNEAGANVDLTMPKLDKPKWTRR
ncbi:MAG TPA: hypothetical protein VGZ00_06470 [Candidatus Baltobacteraceae bacterium]|jgi:hypothetical protein|nr:hypothetical protein [Candidatus Baltobacteraceae bacterium]